MKVDGKSIVKSVADKGGVMRQRTFAAYWQCRFCKKEMARAGVGRLMDHWRMTHWRESGYRHQKKRDKESKFRTCQVRGFQAGAAGVFMYR